MIVYSLKKWIDIVFVYIKLDIPAINEESQNQVSFVIIFYKLILLVDWALIKSIKNIVSMSVAKVKK